MCSAYNLSKTNQKEFWKSSLHGIETMIGYGSCCSREHQRMWDLKKEIFKNQNMLLTQHITHGKM